MKTALILTAIFLLSAGSASATSTTKTVQPQGARVGQPKLLASPGRAPANSNEGAALPVNTNLCVNADGQTLKAGEAGFDDCQAEAQKSPYRSKYNYQYDKQQVAPPAGSNVPVPVRPSGTRVGR